MTVTHSTLNNNRIQEDRFWFVMAKPKGVTCEMFQSLPPEVSPLKVLMPRPYSFLALRAIEFVAGNANRLQLYVLMYDHVHVPIHDRTAPKLDT